MLKSVDVLKKIKDPVVIFGAGVVGEFILDFCNDNGIFVECFCDNRINSMQTIKGKMVYSVTELEKMNKKITFIITIVDIEFIIRQLDQSGFLEWFSIYDIYSLNLLNKNDFLLYHKIENLWYAHRNYILKDMTYLNSVDLVITEKCSLRCKECSNLMQYYKNPVNYNFDEIKLQLGKMLEHFSGIYEIRVIGGEPCMHPQLSRILKLLSQNEKIKNISIWTNGTIVPDENTLAVMEENNIWLSISDYGVLSKKIDELKDKLLIHKINFVCKKVEYWTKCAEIKKHNRTLNEMENIYDNCCVRWHLTLLKGKLYNCPFAANAVNLGAIPISKNDYIDFFEDYQDELKIHTFFERNRVFMPCTYCEGRPVLIKDIEKIVPCEQAKHVINFYGIQK